jgi:hypothetical protein
MLLQQTPGEIEVAPTAGEAELVRGLEWLNFGAELLEQAGYVSSRG